MKQQLAAMRLRQVDDSIKPWAALPDGGPPKGGWVKVIREAIGMSAAQLGTRMGLTRQGVADLERRERERVVSLAALDKAARAMNARVVYAIVPRATLAETVRAQARLIARKQLDKAAHTMHLEAQDVSSTEYASQLEEYQDRLLINFSRRLWDEEDLSRED